MRNLVTAAEVRKWLEKNEKTVYIEAGTIITPAARDAARDNGIEIVEGAAGPRPAVSQAEGPGPGNIDQTLIARIVEEVIAALGQQKTAACEADPCGFKLVRSERLSWSDSGDNVKVKQVFDGKDHPNRLAGLIALEGAAPVREMKGSEIHHVLAGTVSYLINGREYAGQAGDTAFLPAGARVALTAAGPAKIFFVACPDNWWKNCSR